MTDKRDRATADRRGFLKLAGAGAVAGGVALVGGAGGETTAEASAAVDRKDGRYKETDHVRTYYDLARF